MEDFLNASGNRFGLGEIAALTAALLWTSSSILWGRIHLSAFRYQPLQERHWHRNGGVPSAVFVRLDRSSRIPGSSAQFLVLVGRKRIGRCRSRRHALLRHLQILGPRMALMMATTGQLFRHCWGG